MVSAIETVNGDRSAKPEPQRILLVTHPRTCSNLLERILSEQPNTIYLSQDFFLSSRLLRLQILKAGPLAAASPSDKDALREQFKACYEKLESTCEVASRDGKTVIIHVQPPSNLLPSVAARFVHGPNAADGEPEDFWAIGSGPQSTPLWIPDEWLVRPKTHVVLLVRHPALIVDGLWRAMKVLPDLPWSARVTLGKIGATLRFQRAMYDFFISHGFEPLVLDADDFVGSRRKEVLEQLCERTGMDAQKLVWEWQKGRPAEREGETEHRTASLLTLDGSQGVLPGYEWGERSLEKEVEKWTEMYEEKDVEWLKSRVDEMMPDYEYLYKKRFGLSRESQDTGRMI